MYYVRTSGGSMMPVSFKSNTLVVNKKPTTKIKPKAKQKKTSLADPK